MKNIVYKQIDKCIVITKNIEYLQISKVPLYQYENVYSILSLNYQIVENKFFFKKIEKFKNLRFITFDINNHDYEHKIDKITIMNKFAKFRNLSYLGIIDHTIFSLSLCKKNTFIWKNNITFIKPNLNDFYNIPPNIIYLNIINDDDIDYVNIPNTIFYLHISFSNINKYKQTNLPINLIKIIVTIPEIYNNDNDNSKIYSLIHKNTKLPFNCELIIDDVFIDHKI